MKIRKTQKARIREFIDLVSRCCPSLQKLSYDSEHEGIPNRLFLFGKKKRFRSSVVNTASSNVILSVFRSAKNLDVSFSIANMPQFRSKYISEIEMFRNEDWDKDLVICVSDPDYAQCAKELAKEYEMLSKSDEIQVVFDY